MKPRTVFICQSCGAQATRWTGQCHSCGQWNTLAEERIEHRKSGIESREKTGVRPVRLDEIRLSDTPRIATKLHEFDRVLGGGMVPASAVLIGGEPGIGKSTLLLQLVHRAAGNGRPALYITGEESLEQIKLRADRLGATQGSALFLATTLVEDVVGAIAESGAGVVVVDSIQVLRHPDLESAAGTVGQIREVSNLLIEQAKSKGFVLFLVGHVTKEGAIAGPKLLEHMVDTVLYFEGERNGPYRLLRAVKNRFGPTHEMALFEMQGDGLKEVVEPSAFFLSQRSAGSPGSVVTVTMKGTRPLLVEVQALASPAGYGFSQRTSIGMDRNRTALLIAVLEKLAGMSLGSNDIFVNVAGGIEVDEPAVDLAVALAIASSFRNRPLAPDVAVCGELGLAGEVRSASHMESRLREAARIGFKKMLVPCSKNLPPVAGLEAVQVAHVEEALAEALGS